MTESIQERLEYLRGEIRAERIAYGEIAELQDLVKHIDRDDVELLAWAGASEHPKLLGYRPHGEMGGEVFTFEVRGRVIEAEYWATDTLQRGLDLLGQFEQEGKAVHAEAVRRSLRMALDAMATGRHHAHVGACRPPSQDEPLNNETTQ